VFRRYAVGELSEPKKKTVATTTTNIRKQVVPENRCVKSNNHDNDLFGIKNYESLAMVFESIFEKKTFLAAVILSIRTLDAVCRLQNNEKIPMQKYLSRLNLK